MVALIEEYSKIKDILTFAEKRGAKELKIIKTNNIIVEDWVYWKCRFGCPSYGKFLTCPPYSPNPKQTRALLRDYECALLIRYESTEDYHKLLLELEREVFLRGFYKAWSLTAGTCHLCQVCNISEGKCIKPIEARPSMEACGIDVFETARNAGLDLKVLNSKSDDYPRICLLLLR